MACSEFAPGRCVVESVRLADGSDRSRAAGQSGAWRRGHSGRRRPRTVTTATGFSESRRHTREFHRERGMAKQTRKKQAKKQRKTKRKQLKCPVCGGVLRAISASGQARYYRCRACPEAFRADYQLDPNSASGLLLIGIRQNQEFKRRLEEEYAKLNRPPNADILEGASAAFGIMQELDREGIQRELESYILGYED